MSLPRYFALAIFTRVFAFTSEIPPSAIYGTMRCIFPSFCPNITISSNNSSYAVSPGDLSARPAGRVYFPASDGAQLSLLSRGILSHSAVWILIAPTPEKRIPALLLWRSSDTVASPSTGTLSLSLTIEPSGTVTAMIPSSHLETSDAR